MAPVSYTHLSYAPAGFFQRATRSGASASGAVPWKMRSPGVALGYLATVSYTHLDVYKRQIVYFIGITFGMMMGYFGGMFDLGMQRLIEIFSQVPYVPVGGEIIVHAQVPFPVHVVNMLKCLHGVGKRCV